MKYAILTLALVSTLATARTAESYTAEICGNKAEGAAGVVYLARQGMAWKEIETRLKQSQPNADFTHLRTAYYEYSMFDDQTIKALTFMNCKIERIGK